MILKDDKELDALREGGKRLAEVLEGVRKAALPGTTAQELDELARTLIKEKGAKPAFLNYRPRTEARPFPAALCVSINEEIVHGIPNEGKKVLKNGDIVGLDCGIIYKGFYTDSAITVAVGEVDAKGKRLIAATEEALAAGIAAAKVGGHIGDIGAAVAAIAKKYGYAIPKELAGHGVGRAVHEEPTVPNHGKKGEGLALKEGLVIAIEPMFAEGKPQIEVAEDGFSIRMKDRSRSAHAEHTIVITKEGPEILTR